jgi:hypothetical protein
MGFKLNPMSRRRGTLQEVEEVVTRARMWQYKPDGDVTLMTYQAQGGVPVTTFQDPIHYPHGTKFLAPGTPPPTHFPMQLNPKRLGNNM